MFGRHDLGQAELCLQTEASVVLFSIIVCLPYETLAQKTFAVVR